MADINETQTPSTAQKPTKVCPKCGQEIAISAKKCRHCGEWLEKQCPYCGEWINANAEKCKHCGSWLSEVARRRYENRNGITRDKEKAQQGEKKLDDKDKAVLGLAKAAGCFMHIENILLAVCLMFAFDLSLWAMFACCAVFYLLMCISAIRTLYVWFLTFVWGCVGYGAGGWIGAIIVGIISFAIHGLAVVGQEVDDK